MKRSTTRFMILFFAVFMLRLAAPRAAAGQVNSTTSTINVSMSVGESITIQPSSQTLPAFTYTSGAATSGSQQFNLTTTWQLAAGHTSFHSVFWFASGTAALTNGSSSIPASEFFLKVNSGPYSACNTAADPVVPASVAGATCNQGIVYPLAAPYSGQQTDTVTVQLQNLSASLPVGAYTGTLNVAAGAN